jgi:hypothetical protein
MTPEVTKIAVGCVGGGMCGRWDVWAVACGWGWGSGGGVGGGPKMG